MALQRHGSRFHLKGMNVVPIPRESWTIDSLKNQDQLIKAVHLALTNAKPSAISGHHVMIALPESVIFSGTFALPIMPEKELKQALPFEIAEKLSINLEDHYIDYETTDSVCRPIQEALTDKTTDKTATTKAERPNAKPVPADSTHTGDNLTIFAVAAKQALIQSVIDLCNEAKLELAGIDIKPGAVVRSVAAKEDHIARLIIDVGASTTSVSVAEGRSLRLTSSIPLGIKNAGDENTPDILTKFQEKAGPIFDEIVHTTKFFQNRVCPQLSIREMILTGGGSNVQGMAELFQKETGLPAKLSNPLALIETDRYPITEDLARTFAVAAGLAMRQLHD